MELYGVKTERLENQPVFQETVIDTFIAHQAWL